jgi:hypothetical protein
MVSREDTLITPLSSLPRRRAHVWIAVLSSLASVAAEAAPVSAPLPPLRPADLISPRAPAAPGREMFGPPRPPPIAQPAPAAPVSDATCDRLLAAGKVVATVAPAVSGSEGCGIAAPVRLSAILLRTGGQIAVKAPALLRCDFTERLADWVRDDLAPLLAAAPSRFVALSEADSYECRGRNRVAGAKLSEHATGNAIDIRSIVFADNNEADITRVAQKLAVFAQVKLTACTRFSTVLGPGSDGFHEDNLHLDGELRRSGAVFCRWRLP